MDTFFMATNSIWRCIKATSEAFRLNSPSAARERQIMLYLSRFYDINMHFKKLCDKRFRRIFSSAFQWCRWFFWNFPFSPPTSIKHTKAEHFLRRKGFFSEFARMFSWRNRTWKSRRSVSFACGFRRAVHRVD